MSNVPVLIVDDNDINLKLLEHVTAHHGYDVQTAGDANGAIAAIAVRRPALILMDMQMPGIDGFELTRRLKADATTRAITIVAVTAFAMKGDEARALAAGCDSYVAKPIDTRALPRLLQRLLESRS
jgi:two-component system, cell cycle response regulator DivK